MKINEKIEQISNKYRQLRKCEIPIVQKMTIAELKKLSAEALKIISLEETVQNNRRKRQIEDILKKCQQVEVDIEVKLKQEEKVIGRMGRINDRGQLSRMVARSIVMQQVKSSQLKISDKQIDQIAERMQKNLQVMKEIEEMVVEQGEDLEQIESYLSKAYDNTELANQQLEEANKLQQINRMMKLRMAVTGFFGALGLKILGFPGLIAGMLFGYRSTK